MHQKSTGMKKIFEKIVEGILTCSGFVTSVTILLIVLFLFTEAFGLFGSKVIEEGYVLALNKENKVNQLSPAQIKDVFDEEITNWEELGGENLPIRVFRLEDITRYYTEEELGLPDVVFHSLSHTSVTYKLKLSGGDIKAVQGDSGHAQADMVTEVYGHIIDEDRRKNAEMMENAFYNKENLNPQMRDDKGEGKKIEVPEGVDAELLMKVLANPEMAALLTSLAKTVK